MIISNLQISNSTYTNLAPPEEFVWGVIGDYFSFFCDFELATAAGAADFYFNLIPNSKSPYTSPGNFTIANDVFKNLHSQTIQVFKGELPVSNSGQVNLTPANPNNFFDGIFVFVGVDVANRKYRVRGRVRILPLIREADINGSDFVIPSWFAGGESLKAVFKINSKVSTLNATVVETTDTINLTSFFKNGNIGYLNEKLNGQTADFSLQPNSTVWQNGLTTLDSGQVSKVIFQIKKASGNNNATTKVSVRATTPNDTFGTATYLNTQKFDEALLDSNGIIVNGVNGKLTACKATVNSGDSSLIDVEVSFAVGSYTSVALWAEVSENPFTTTFNDYNSNNVWVFFTEETAQITNPVELQKLGDANGEISFLYHYSDKEVTQSYNHIVAFVGDWLQGLTKIVPKNGAIIEQITIQIKRKSGAILDNIGTYNTTNLPILLTRGFKLLNTIAGGKYRQDISIAKVGNNIECKFAFKILPDWTAFTDIVAAVIVRGTQRNLPFDIEFQSPSSVLQTYELSLNANTEPKALGYTIPQTSKQIFVDGVEVDEIIKGKENRLKFSFRDDNLNDLQAVLADLVAYFTVNYVNEGITTQHSIHSVWDINPASPFKEVLGHTAGRVKITIIPPIFPATVSKEAFIECILDDTKLVAIYGDQKYCITGRLDRINPPQYLETYLLHLRGNNVNDENFRPVLSFTTGFSYFECEEVLDGSIVANSLLFKYSQAVNPIWAAIPALDAAATQDLINLSNLPFKILPVPVISSGLSECTLQFSVAKFGISPANSWSYNFGATISFDTVVGFKNLVQFSGIIGATSNTYYNIRNDVNTDWGQPSVFNLGNLNAEILLLPSETPFELQIIDISNANLTFNYNYV